MTAIGAMRTSTIAVTSFVAFSTTAVTGSTRTLATPVTCAVAIPTTAVTSSAMASARTCGILSFILIGLWDAHLVKYLFMVLNHSPQLDWCECRAFYFIVLAWLGWLRAGFSLSLVGLWDAHLALDRAGLHWWAMRHLLLGPHWLVGPAPGAAHDGGARSFPAVALARGPHQLHRRADLKGLVCAIFFWRLGGLSDAHLVKHMVAPLNQSQQVRWREGLASYFVVPTCRGWLCAISSLGLIGLWDAHLVKCRLTTLHNFSRGCVGPRASPLTSSGRLALADHVPPSPCSSLAFGTPTWQSTCWRC